MRMVLYNSSSVSSSSSIVGSGLDEATVAVEWGGFCEDGFGWTCEVLEKGNCLLGGSCISGDFKGVVMASFDLTVSNAFPLAGPTET
jgi:hypothetical protein